MSTKPCAKRYSTDVDDTEWLLIEPFLRQKPGRGRKRTVNIREVANAIFYIDRTGCQWEMLPKDFPDYRHVNYYYLKWMRDGTWDTVLTTLREIVRMSEGRAEEPTAAILDSQSVKTVGPGEEQGYDGGKHVKGRKRFIAVDTMGLLLGVMVMAASVSEPAGGVELLDELNKRFPTLQKIWADSAYGGELVEYVQKWCRFVLEIVKRAPDQRGFQVQMKRWIVERTLGWMNWWRRLSKDYEKTIESSESMVKISMIRLMLKRLSVVVGVL
jgi:putative transposase